MDGNGGGKGGGREAEGSPYYGTEVLPSLRAANMDAPFLKALDKHSSSVIKGATLTTVFSSSGM